MLEDAALSVPGVQQATANVDFKIIAHSVQRGVPLLPGVKNMIAVASGKGGVARAPRRPIWRWRWPPKARAWACLTPTSTAPASPP